MKRTQNVIIFSAGESVRNGKVEYLQRELEKKGIHCSDWRSLFRLAHKEDRIALLPALSKKIPTFDFALILAEGVDTVKYRGSRESSAMRDNVIFELGLCVMGLGAERVILLAESGVRIPEDLKGVEEVGVAYITYDDKCPDNTVDELGELVLSRADALPDSLADRLVDIIDHIQVNADLISPVFVGAAVSSAEAYFMNFIVRLLECLESGAPVRSVSGLSAAQPSDFSVKIVIPESVSMLTRSYIRDYYDNGGYREYVIDNAGFRSLSFFGKYDEEGRLCIADVPTSVTASYTVVNSILSIDSDDDYDLLAEERFKAKEMDMYTFALKRLLTPEVAAARLAFLPEKKRIAVTDLLSKVSVVNEIFAV